MGKISIAVTIDENYARHFGVMLMSMMDKTRSEIDVYVLFDHFSEETFEKLNAIADRFNGLILLYRPIDNAQFENLHLTRHFPSICYYRFQLGSVLPEQVTRVIYLDPDIIVTDDIQKLWGVEQGNKWLSAVPFSSRRLSILGLSKSAGYFNSGVLLMNLTEWRKLNLEKACFSKARELGKVLVNPDQDVLNVVCKGNWGRLSLRWNMINGFFSRRALDVWSAEEIHEAKANKGIIHFTGSCKPWHYGSNHPMRKLYWHYLKQTPWKEISPENKSLKSALVRLVPFRWKDTLITIYIKLSGRKLT